MLQNHIYIYIYANSTFKDLDFGDVLERVWRGIFGEQKSQNTCVLQLFLIATINNSLVFLGFLRFGDFKSLKTAVFYMVF